MTDWSKVTDAERGTWGAFVLHAIAHGATVVLIEDVTFADGQTFVMEMLQRWEGTESREYPIPRYCHPGKAMNHPPMAEGCKRLGIPRIQPWPWIL